VSHRRAEPVEVVEYDRSWPEDFERLKARALDALGELAVRIEHVGSTAVPGLAAKPVVDLYVVLDRAESLPEAISRLERLGYVLEGDLGVPGRGGLGWAPGERRHHLYLCDPEHAGLDDLIRFRDHLRRHPEDAARYGELKPKLAVEHRDDRDAYADGKRSFIEQLLAGSST
jgi:GrpB-like predicted nucleotidyltransferase (UPF0157 family)